MVIYWITLLLINIFCVCAQVVCGNIGWVIFSTFIAIFCGLGLFAELTK